MLPLLLLLMPVVLLYATYSLVPHVRRPFLPRALPPTCRNSVCHRRHQSQTAPGTEHHLDAAKAAETCPYRARVASMLQVVWCSFSAYFSPDAFLAQARSESCTSRVQRPLRHRACVILCIAGAFLSDDAAFLYSAEETHGTMMHNHCCRRWRQRMCTIH